MTNNNTITNIEQTRNITFKRRNGCMMYTGTVVMKHEVRTAQDSIDVLDFNNCSGSADFHKTDKLNMYTLIVYVFID